MRWAVLLAVALTVASASRVSAAPTPAEARVRTQAMLHDVCTALNAPCNTCGGKRGTGPPPTQRPADDPLRHPVDAWGRALQITVGGNGVTLRSAGADGELGTADDQVEACGTPTSTP